MTLSILMFCPQFRPIVGGAERQAEKLAKALVQKGGRVTVLTPLLTPDAALFEEVDGVEIRRFSVFDLCRRFPGVRGLGPLNLLQIRLQIMREVDQRLKGVDVMHAHTASPVTAFAMLAAKRRGVPVTCKVAMAGERSDLDEVSKIRIGGQGLALSMVDNLDRWIATTVAVSDTLTRWGIPADRVARIPNGVELPVLAEPIGRLGVAKRFLYLGRLSTNIQRDVPSLVRAFDVLAAQSSDVELALVGDGDLFQETAELVAKCQHRARIHMPGLQEPEPWLRWGDCFVLPSRREGLSNALLEAMAHGLACIANDIPPNREVLADGEAGTLVPVDDELALLAAMSRMASDPAHTNVMRAASMRRVQEHYSIESVADRHIRLFEALSSANP